MKIRLYKISFSGYHGAVDIRLALSVRQLFCVMVALCL